MVPTSVWDTYWTFAYRRHAMWEKRSMSSDGPWTEDPILSDHRFTNSYRILDRVSQYLVAEIQYGDGRSQAPAEIFFRTILFKIFNKIETWKILEERLGRISWQATDLIHISKVMDEAMARGGRLYSAAYIMPSPPFGHERKHNNHIELLRQMMHDGLPGKISAATSLEQVYSHLLDYPGVGKFLAFQWAIDLNYSSMIDHDEKSFVIAGPGAHDGLSKCFSNLSGLSAEEAIMRIFEMQDSEFSRLNLPFKGLFGRPLMPIDIQNCFCETSKYTRVSHPDVAGIAGRTKIKQRYSSTGRPLPSVFLPPKWKIEVPPEFKNEQAPVQSLLL